MDGMEARVAALERTTAQLERTTIQHDKRIAALEQQQAAADATTRALQDDVREAKAAAQHAAAGVDSLKMWLLATIAGFGLNLLYMILRGGVQ